MVIGCYVGIDCDFCVVDDEVFVIIVGCDYLFVGVGLVEFDVLFDYVWIV